ncbi:MAG: hypothetical protein EOP04_23970 [Proteobacteria bacterium]|nr:MAG: hypothetical protein EOP04_23970 [Pseudomonadota bacterium]
MSQKASDGDSRSKESFQKATLQVNRDAGQPFSRIDGNHRLSAAPEDPKFASYNVPFCLLLFRNADEAQRFGRVLFHNINYKHVPLEMEHNLKLILEDDNLFPDEELKNHPSFGWPYYLARRLYGHIDYDLLPHIRSYLENEPRTFLVQQMSFLISRGTLGSNENAFRRFKDSLVRANTCLNEYAPLRESKNPGLLAALIYYELQPRPVTKSFVRWVLQNHLHRIVKSGAADLIEIFDKVLESRRRTIFVSMPFGRESTEVHYRIIQRVCAEISQSHQLNPVLKPERVDWFHDGTSYEIEDKILDMISDCGLLLGNLTCFNPNVYHEIGYLMGKAKAEGNEACNMLLFLDESVPENDKKVGFNLQGIKQLRFRNTEDFARDLRVNIEKFFNLEIV